MVLDYGNLKLEFYAKHWGLTEVGHVTGVPYVRRRRARPTSTSSGYAGWWRAPYLVLGTRNRQTVDHLAEVLRQARRWRSPPSRTRSRRCAADALNSTSTDGMSKVRGRRGARPDRSKIEEKKLSPSGSSTLSNSPSERKTRCSTKKHPLFWFSETLNDLQMGDIFYFMRG